MLNKRSLSTKRVDVKLRGVAKYACGTGRLRPAATNVTGKRIRKRSPLPAKRSGSITRESSRRFKDKDQAKLVNDQLNQQEAPKASLPFVSKSQRATCRFKRRAVGEVVGNFSCVALCR
ncbi:hypothetical protein JAAARDRAFT_629824 [Jaapia argillacea MUCL 33604]|uniref:Uncharacterized protein n=1 Tax=Jaapia argillacea MUCL 33604 TaxID=933084 RepID=A0A067Q0N2_9AGAM|nr:hypothetical protein JAAARDRAFT_629824 [Jaapia argillacea MUCL 33604]